MRQKLIASKLRHSLKLPQISKLFFQEHEENNDILTCLDLRVKRSRLTLTLKSGRLLTGERESELQRQVRKCVYVREAAVVGENIYIYIYILSTRSHSILVLCRVHSCCHSQKSSHINPLNAELNPICYLLALLAHHFLHVSRIRVKSLTLRLLMSYIYIYTYIYIYMERLFLRFLDHTQRRSTVGRTPLDE